MASIKFKHVWKYVKKKNILGREIQCQTCVKCKKIKRHLLDYF